MEIKSDPVRPRSAATSAPRILLMRKVGVTKIILCADHFYNKIIACFCAILRIYAPSLEGSRDAFRHELIVFQTSKLAEKAPIQRASCLGSRQDSDYERSSQFEIWLVLRLNGAKQVPILYILGKAFSRQRGKFFFRASKATVTAFEYPSDTRSRLASPPRSTRTTQSSIQKKPLRKSR